MSFTKKIVTTYAKSLFQNVNNSAKTSATEKPSSFEISNVLVADPSRSFTTDVHVIGEELLLLSSALTASKQLNAFFKNPTFAEAQKLEVFSKTFPGLTPMTKSFLKVLTERSHLYLIPEIYNEYNSLLLKFKNLTVVKLITASSLQESYGQNLLNSLKTLTNSKDIILNVAYNPKLLGGLILEYKSASIDASILKEFSLFFNEA